MRKQSTIHPMESEAFKVLRDRSKGTVEFRKASDTVTQELIDKIPDDLNAKEDIVLVIILRAGMAFLPAALRAFPDAKVSVLGLKRDEKTAVAFWYYENIPPLSKDTTVIILDPMLATGGSAKEAINKLIEEGADAANIHFVGVIAAPEGYKVLTDLIPKENVILGAIDEGLDDTKFIVPGLGDYGNRYFGYQD